MKRSKFSLSHYRLLTCDMGYLIPLTWFEALPGDSIQQASSLLLRVSPVLSPVMHPVSVRVHHWFVPYRLIWSDWEDFITGGPDGNDASTLPYISSAAVAEGSLDDYLGVPVDAAYSPNLEYSALARRAYALIFNDHYRDQDLVSALTIDLTDGLDTTTNASIQKVAWEKDYFTTSRPWEQKGTQVTVPIGTEAPVKGIGKFDQTYASSSIAVYESDDTNPTYATASPIDHAAATTRLYVEQGTTGYPNIHADLSAATGISVNDLRLALAIQRYQEARAQYGSRYVEYLRYLGVSSKDQRLQSPEYLGGGRQTIQFSEVLGTGGDDAGVNSPIGAMRGHGISAMRTNRYRRFFEEHGIIMSLLSVVPKAIYGHALHRKWSRETKEDFFQRELQFIGEQAVLNKEVYAPHASPDATFGYQARYDEYRSHPSGISGEFLSTLDHWHFTRLFASDPSLNQTFTDCTPTKRTLASAATDAMYIMANHSIQARRMLTARAKGRTF